MPATGGGSDAGRLIKITLLLFQPLFAIVILVAAPLFWADYQANLELILVNSLESVTLHSRLLSATVAANNSLLDAGDWMTPAEDTTLLPSPRQRRGHTFVLTSDGQPFGNQKTLSFNRLPQEVWAYTDREKAATIETPQGLFTFLAFSPREIAPIDTVAAAAAPETTAVHVSDDRRSRSPAGRLLIVNHVPSSILTGMQIDSLSRLSRTIVPIILLFTLVSWFVARLWLKQIKASEELREAKNAADSANRAKSEFLAMMSHEIRTPMNAIVGMTELIMSTPLTERQRHFASAIESSADALLTIINDILDFSRIEAGRLTIKPANFDMQELVEDLGQLMAPRAQAKGLELIVRYAPGTPRWLVGDGIRIRQVLTNLTGNAVKFTESGHVMVNVECTRISEGRAALVLKVTDTGIGIPSEAQAKIFERFTQVDSSTTRHFQGAGLGLTISRQLVEMMQGTISVASESGHGSIFTVELTLPLGVEECTAPASDLTGAHALVVDDNEINRFLLNEQLSGFGLQVETASTAAQALEKVQAGRFEVILTDQHLPDHDGVWLIRQLRRIQLEPPVTVILSSVAEAEIDSAPGVSAILSKPVRVSRLKQVLEEAWRRFRQGGDSVRETLAAASESEAARDATGRAATGESAPPSRDELRFNARVLVVEDHPVNRMMAETILSETGCAVETAATGREAVVKTRSGTFDVIFMDCQMPEMDGFEATRLIREAEAGGARRVPIIALTAHALDGSREACLEAGMDDFITKPFRRNQIVEAVRKHAGVPRTGAAIGARRHEARTDTPEVFVESGPVLDLPSLVENVGDDPALIRGLLKRFQETMREDEAAMARAVASGDFAAAARVAHRIKGAAAAVGARRLAGLCGRIEGAARAQIAAELRSLAPRLETLIRVTAERVAQETGGAS
jgi:signal transduction histidine kinase/CheY-like chemotaxis protein/HPt (histidine-containing phosphotransfer) domain-containing protein